MKSQNEAILNDSSHFINLQQILTSTFRVRHVKKFPLPDLIIGLSEVAFRFSHIATTVLYISQLILYGF